MIAISVNTIEGREVLRLSNLPSGRVRVDPQNVSQEVKRDILKSFRNVV